MKGIVFIPEKRCVITTDFDKNEAGRIHEIIDILGSVDIKTIPYKGDMIYTLRKDQKSLPEDKGICGCIVSKGLVDEAFLGNAVILGIDKDGFDKDCTLDMNKIYTDFQIKIFTRNKCVDDNR